MSIKFTCHDNENDAKFEEELTFQFIIDKF